MLTDVSQLANKRLMGGGTVPSVGLAMTVRDILVPFRPRCRLYAASDVHGIGRIVCAAPRGPHTTGLGYYEGERSALGEVGTHDVALL